MIFSLQVETLDLFEKMTDDIFASADWTLTLTDDLESEVVLLSTVKMGLKIQRCN